MNNKVSLLLSRYTSLEIDEICIEDYLRECKETGDNLTKIGLLDFLCLRYSFDNFNETIDETKIEDSDFNFEEYETNIF